MLRPVSSALAAVALLAAVGLCAGCGDPTPTAASGSPAADSPTSTPGSPTSSATATPLPAPVQNGPLRVRPAGGTTSATRDNYHWVVEGTPAEQYTITVLQGLGPQRAVRTLGRIHDRLGDLTGLGALQYVESHLAAHPVPCVVQAARIGATTVLYQPDGSLASRHIRALGASRMAAYFSTDENWDTRIEVVSKGRVIRTLDPFAAITHGDRGALPQERGLRIGHGLPFAVSWALLERVSLTHITQNWLVNTEHPTYVISSAHC